ncbi:MAG: carbon starvation protein A [Chitinivibrionia bacterium]|nr:carbon starvation protein A [Chitinivibrionia bacterium]
MVYLLLISIVLFILAYRWYGAFLERQFDIDPGRPTPAHVLRDGVDYVPARTPVLMGHHFSSIAGAGPIVGPIIAVSFFGWLPVVLWIVLGAIFIGGVHDYASLAMSIRHKAQSVAQITKDLLSPRAHKLFLIFIWFTLVYVLTVFVDLTAVTFMADGGVATSSAIYIALAILFGLFLYRLHLSLAAASIILVPFVFASVYIGQLIPMSHPAPIAHGDPKTTWTVILLGYCFIASVTPVWILLQPRDYLSSYLLFACILGGTAGILIGRPPLDTDPFLGFHTGLGYLFPALFITVACGACSGFHSVVASGTTAKQLSSERAARPVAYGSMLVESMLALIAVGAIVVAGGSMGGGSPPQLFAEGMGTFLQALGIPRSLGVPFGLLALSTFLLTTLDTATRLARYILEEFFNIWSYKTHLAATAATIAPPLWFALIRIEDSGGRVIPVWEAIWPVFGSTNQLLGALALMTAGVWLRRRGKRALFVFIPMFFMLSATLLALVQLVAAFGWSFIGGIAALLIILAVILGIESLKACARRRA